jgi:two-component system cell cycle response regulator DivK
VAATILLVEDDPPSREGLARFLTRRGHAVLFAADGAEAVQAVRERQPDLVLLDLSLPVMDGWEVTRRLRADAFTRSVPIIALSAHALPRDRASALAAGADDFEPKPVDVPHLLAKLDALLQARREAAPAALVRPAAQEHLAELVAFVLDRARAAGTPAETLHAVRLAVEEVCLNVMLHGYAHGSAGPLRVAVERRDDALLVVVADEAPPFDPATAPKPCLDAPLEERAPGGLGWHLVRSVMDEVRYERADPVGNVVTLVKRLGGDPAASGRADKGT